MPIPAQRPVLLALLSTLPMHALAASFDCQQASTLVEFAICADPELSALDQRLEQAYRHTRQSGMPGSENEWKAQKDWLAERNRCSSLTCLMSAYAERSASLLDYRGPYGGKPVVGVYEHASRGRIGRLDLLQTEATGVRFRLDVVSETGATLRVSGLATLRDNMLAYTDPALHCSLNMRFQPGRVLLSQTGACSQGRPLVVEGSYHQSQDKAPLFQRF